MWKQNGIVIGVAEVVARAPKLVCFRNSRSWRSMTSRSAGERSFTPQRRPARTLPSSLRILMLGVAESRMTGSALPNWDVAAGKMAAAKIALSARANLLRMEPPSETAGMWQPSQDRKSWRSAHDAPRQMTPIQVRRLSAQQVPQTVVARSQSGQPGGRMQRPAREDVAVPGAMH